MSVEFCYVMFCFKQKTAYEMLTSDWSSDVCSSDLPASGKDKDEFPEHHVYSLLEASPDTPRPREWEVIEKAAGQGVRCSLSREDQSIASSPDRKSVV